MIEALRKAVNEMYEIPTSITATKMVAFTHGEVVSDKPLTLKASDVVFSPAYQYTNRPLVVVWIDPDTFEPVSEQRIEFVPK